MEEPLVSISLVTYNQDSYIREAIESCLMQQVDFKYELIIHDDASSDNTPQVITEYAKNYPEIIVPILQSENQFSKGLEINASISIPQARGKYIAFLEGDDYWIDPLKLKTQIELLEQNKDIAMCFTATKHIYPNTSRKPTHKRYRKHDAVCSIKDVILLGGRLVDMGSAVVRRSIFNHVPEWYFYAQIWDLTVPLLSILSGKIQYLDQVTSVYRYNVSGSWTQNNVNDLERRKTNTKKSLRATDGFDKTTKYQYHKFIQRKHDSMIVEILLLSNDQDDDFDGLYSRLSISAKLEYRLFNILGSFRLWKLYRNTKRQFTGY